MVMTPQRPTGTFLPTKHTAPTPQPAAQPPSKQQVVMGSLRLLQAQYIKVRPLAPAGLDHAYAAIAEIFRDGLITTQDVFDTWRRIPADKPEIMDVKHHVGWLLAHSNKVGQPTDVAAYLSLDERKNPWPSQSVPMRPASQIPVTPPPVEPPPIAPAPSIPYAPGGEKDPTGELLPHPDAFKGYMGRLKGQHILVVEGIVPGGPTIMQILLGAAQENKDPYGRSTVKGVIVDLTGETYLGLETDEHAVYYDGMLNGADALTKEERYFLPQMEGIYQAARVLDGRIDIKKRNARAGTPCEEFSPYYAVVRLWNVVSKDWNALTEATRKSLQDTWRTHYGHGDEETLDIKRAIARIFDLAHTANVVLVLSVSRLGKVEEMGLSTYDLNSMTVLIVAEPRIDGGTKAVNAAMRDGRLEFVSAHRDRIKEQLEVALIRYRAQHQFVLASVEPPEVFPLETSKISATGEMISIVNYKSKMLSGFANV